MLGEPAPMVVAVDWAAARHAGAPSVWLLHAARVLIEVGALAGLTSVMVVMVMAQPRIFLAMSRDGLLPAWAGRIHPRFHTPALTTMITGAAVALSAGLTGIGALSNLVNIGTLFAFVLVSLGIIFLRVNRPDLPRPFRTPLVPVLPVVSALASIGLMASLPRDTWERLVGWMALGLVVYFAYGWRHSRARPG
jgi:APA family basic amino acid/polyamine antiporter